MLHSILLPIKHQHMIHFHIFQSEWRMKMQKCWQKITQRISPSAAKKRWQNMLKRWLALWIKALKYLITVIQSVMKHVKVDLNVHSHFQVLCLLIFAHYFVKVKVHFAGRLYLVIQRIFIEPTKRYLICSQKMKHCIVGSQWRKRKLLSKDYLHVFAG